MKTIFNTIIAFIKKYWEAVILVISVTAGVVAAYFITFFTLLGVMTWWVLNVTNGGYTEDKERLICEMIGVDYGEYVSSATEV